MKVFGLIFVAKLKPLFFTGEIKKIKLISGHSKGRGR
jgi:hypothetical protein